MRNGWTGGAYSVARAVLGLTVAVQAGLLLGAGLSEKGLSPSSPWRQFPGALRLHDAPWMGTVVLAAVVLAALAFAVGLRDRIAAIVLVWLGLSLQAGAHVPTSTWICVGALLVWHVFVAPRPYGSFDARGRTDPGGGWSLNPRLFGAVWSLVGLALLYHGLRELSLGGEEWRTTLEEAWSQGVFDGTRLGALLDALKPAGYARLRWALALFHLALAPLAFIPRARPWVWSLLLGACVIRKLVFVPLSSSPTELLWHVTITGIVPGLLLLLLFAFDPAWIRPKGGDEHETVFYDGDCGLCHGTVRFLLAEDTGGVLRYSPLQSPAFEAAVPPEERAGLPDSVVVQTVDGRLLVRSTGVAHLLQRLGGLWRVLGTVLAWIPRPLRDLGYDAVARVRKRIFPAPQGACPMVAPHLSDRFLI